MNCSWPPHYFYPRQLNHVVAVLNNFNVTCMQDVNVRSVHEKQQSFYLLHHQP